jgi:hypothetical protein
LRDLNSLLFDSSCANLQAFLNTLRRWISAQSRDHPLFNVSALLSRLEGPIRKRDKYARSHTLIQMLSWKMHRFVCTAQAETYVYVKQYNKALSCYLQMDHDDLVCVLVAESSVLLSVRTRTEVRRRGVAKEFSARIRAYRERKPLRCSEG